MIGILAAAATLPTVLGLQLGAPLSIPECHRMVLQYPHSDGSPAPYETDQPVECAMHDVQLPGAMEAGAIVFPPQAMASIMGATNFVGMRLIDGRLAELSIATLDYNHAGYIVDQLTAKFGKPVSDVNTSEDLDSIAVPSRVIVWRGPGYRAEYRSVASRVDSGLVLIQTDEALAQRAREAAAVKAQQTPL